MDINIEEGYVILSISSVTLIASIRKHRNS